MIYLQRGVGVLGWIGTEAQPSVNGLDVDGFYPFVFVIDGFDSIKNLYHIVPFGNALGEVPERCKFCEQLNIQRAQSTDFSNWDANSVFLLAIRKAARAS